MIDTSKFYKENYEPNSYYSKFYNQLVVIQIDRYVYVDAQEIIDRFKNICNPPESSYELNNAEFLLLCFWLNWNSYVIKQFPTTLARPISLYEFAYNDIRKHIRKDRGLDGLVQWFERRDLCDKLSIVSNSTFQTIPNDLEQKIQLISTRGSEFDGMTVDEKLQNLNNLIENLLKPKSKGDYLQLNYSDAFFGFLSEEDVKKYRKSTQSFRHAASDTLIERASISESEKKFLVELGVFIIIQLHSFLNKSLSGEVSNLHH